MSQQADFSDAHERHQEDAELLFREQRWANADQLYGFSAECGLKTIMRAHGMAVDGKGVPQDRDHRTHIQDLWPVFGTFARQRQLPRYLAQLPSGTPFADWSHHDRCAHHRHFDREVVRPHRDAADKVAGLVTRWRLGGMP